jgi:hypothetical protein
MIAVKAPFAGKDDLVHDWTPSDVDRADGDRPGSFSAQKLGNVWKLVPVGRWASAVISPVAYN